MLLRPVTFLYRPEYVHGDQTLQYGLIAEEVARIYPELVEYSADGQPQAVRYHLLSSMLLNEVQKQQRMIQSLEQQSGTVKRENMELKTRLDQLERSISKLQRLARKPHISKRR